MSDARKYPWMAEPGKVFDCRGYPIYPGDLCKQPHFTERSGRKHWLYHVAILVDGGMKMVPAHNLETTKANGGGDYWLREDAPRCEALEIIAGYGPGECLDYKGRKRIKGPTP